MATTKNVGNWLRNKLKQDPALAKAVEEHAFDAEIASLVYDARQAAGLTQKQLADLIGTQQSVIARLEDWDYSGHSLTMLKRIADALGRKLHVELRPRNGRIAQTPHRHMSPKAPKVVPAKRTLQGLREVGASTKKKRKRA